MGKTTWVKWVTMGMSMLIKWRNGHDVALATTRRENSTKHRTEKICQAVLQKCSGPWVSPYGWNGKITMLLHNYRSRQFHTILRKSVLCFQRCILQSINPIGTRFQKLMAGPTRSKWANDQDVEQLTLQVYTIPQGLSIRVFGSCVTGQGPVWNKWTNDDDVAQLQV